MPGYIITYNQLVAEEKANLQKRMNCEIGKKYSVLLMSDRSGAPYRDKIDANGAAMIMLEVVHTGWKASGKLVVAPSLKRGVTSQQSETADVQPIGST